MSDSAFGCQGRSSGRPIGDYQWAAVGVGVGVGVFADDAFVAALSAGAEAKRVA
jgi:hypothetical protein